MRCESTRWLLNHFMCIYLLFALPIVLHKIFSLQKPEVYDSVSIHCFYLLTFIFLSSHSFQSNQLGRQVEAMVSAFRPSMKRWDLFYTFLIRYKNGGLLYFFCSQLVFIMTFVANSPKLKRPSFCWWSNSMFSEEISKCTRDVNSVVSINRLGYIRFICFVACSLAKVFVYTKCH